MKKFYKFLLFVFILAVFACDFGNIEDKIPRSTLTLGEEAQVLSLNNRFDEDKILTLEEKAQVLSLNNRFDSEWKKIKRKYYSYDKNGAIEYKDHTEKSREEMREDKMKLIENYGKDLEALNLPKKFMILWVDKWYETEDNYLSNEHVSVATFLQKSKNQVGMSDEEFSRRIQELGTKYKEDRSNLEKEYLEKKQKFT